MYNSGRRYKNSVIVCASVGRECALALWCLGFSVTVGTAHCDYPANYYWNF